jgi:hypothetical protein
MLRVTSFALACALALPLHAQSPVKSYGQELVDRVVASDPGVLVVVMHVTPPDSKENVIIASNIGRIGKPADEDDLRVINTENTNLEVAHNGRRFEVELVLRDMTGGNIGALGLVFPYRAGDSKVALEGKANAIRDALAKRILTAANLVEPFPYESRATTKTHAQKIVDATLAKHPDIVSLAMHVTPPDSSDNNIIIIASNFGRIGKKGDQDDLKVVTTGQPISGVYAQGKRFGVELPMLDRAHNTVGALSVGFRHRDGDDQKVLFDKAEQLRDELARDTPSLASLVELDP